MSAAAAISVPGADAKCGEAWWVMCDAAVEKMGRPPNWLPYLMTVLSPTGSGMRIKGCEVRPKTRGKYKGDPIPTGAGRASVVVSNEDIERARERYERLKAEGGLYEYFL